VIFQRNPLFRLGLALNRHLNGKISVNKQVFTILDQFNFHHTMAETSGVAIVIFSGPACGSCRAWKQLLGNYQKRHPDVRLFEIDTERDQALASEFSVFHLPALFAYRDGRYHAAISCEATIGALDETLHSLLMSPAQDAP